VFGHDDPCVECKRVLQACRGEGVREEIGDGGMEELDAPITGEGEESGRARALAPVHAAAGRRRKRRRVFGHARSNADGDGECKRDGVDGREAKSADRAPNLPQSRQLRWHGGPRVWGGVLEEVGATRRRKPTILLKDGFDGVGYVLLRAEIGYGTILATSSS